MRNSQTKRRKRQKKDPTLTPQTGQLKRLDTHPAVPLIYVEEMHKLVKNGKSIPDIQSWLHVEKGIKVSLSTLYRVLGGVRNVRTAIVTATTVSAAKLYVETDLKIIDRVVVAMEVELFKDITDLKIARCYSDILYKFLRLRLDFCTVESTTTTTSDKVSEEANKLIMSKLGIKPDDYKAIAQSLDEKGNLIEEEEDDEQEDDD